MFCLDPRAPSAATPRPGNTNTKINTKTNTNTNTKTNTKTRSDGQECPSHMRNVQICDKALTIRGGSVS